MKCPKCGEEMHEVDCGPDSYENDIFYISDVCYGCELWLDGWFDSWYNTTYEPHDDDDGYETWQEALEN